MPIFFSIAPVLCFKEEWCNFPGDGDIIAQKHVGAM
jgi:hypothetical protein